MLTETMTILFLLTLCLILGISLIIIIQDVFKLEKRLQLSDEENKAFKETLQQKADIVLEDAWKRAVNVVNDANQKAIDIISATENFNEAAKTELRTNLQAVTRSETQQLTQVSRDLEKEYQEAMKQVQTNASELSKNITKEIEKQAAAELAGFTAELRGELLQSQRRLQDRMLAEYETAQKDVESYKQSQIAAAQQQVFELVRFLTEAAVGKGLSIGQQHDLVVNALEEAKAQGVIR